MKEGINEEVANILFQRYRSDDGSSYSSLDVNKQEHRKSLRPNTPLAPTHVAALEKKWLVSSSKCDLDDLKRLLDRDDDLVNKKDFFTGFAAVHWAAKKGRVDVMSWLSEQEADMNIRTNGGYTPLHIATIHKNSDVIRRLIKDFDADINLRDNSGRKARHYVSDELPFAVYRALQETPSIIDMQIDPNINLAAPNAMHLRAYSVPTSNSMPAIADQSPPEVVKKKKKGLSISNSFKGKKKFLVIKREPRDSDSPGEERKPRWRKALSVPDVSAISGPYAITFEQDI